MSIVLFFKELAAHSFEIINLHHEEQIDSVSRFLFVSFIVAKYTFYQSTTTPLKPYLGKGICKISHSIALYNSAKIRTESRKTKRLYKTNRNCCCCRFFFFFCSFFKQQVSEHTRLFSDCHKEHFNGFSTALSWLEIIPRYLQNFLIE